MFLKQFLSYFAGAPDNFHVDVQSVEKIGRTFYFATETDIKEFTSEIESLKGDIKQNEKEIAGLEDDLFDEKSHNDKLEKELAELRATLNSFELSPGDTIGDLIGRNEELAARVAQMQDSLNKFHRRHEEDSREIQNLKARKNKATVKRCLTTGRLLASFGDAEYELVKKN